MKKLTLAFLVLSSTSLFAQDAFVSIGSCVLQGDPTTKFRVFTNDMEGRFTKPGNGLLVAEVPHPESGHPSIISAFTMNIRRLSAVKIVAQTPFGDIALVDGKKTTLSSTAGAYVCTKDE